MTPRFNRPGLSWLPYRAGTYGSFLAAMKARLSSADYPELAALTTREASDPAIALLDAWATVADVLTFYQERDANEGFLRTATEDASVFELARLIGYRRRPGVAASVFLAYGLEKDARVTIARGSRVQSVPGPGQLPQTYETSSDLVSRAEWSAMRPRLTIPQDVERTPGVLYFKGTALGLKPNDPLLFVDESAGKATATRFARIRAVEAFLDRGVTRVVLQLPSVVTSVTLSAAAGGPEKKGAEEPKIPTFTTAALAVAARLKGGDDSVPVQVTLKLHDVPDEVQTDSSMLADVLAELDPRVPAETLQTAVSRARVTAPQTTSIYAFRVQAGPFGHNAPKRAMFERANQGPHEGELRLVAYDEWQLAKVSEKDDIKKTLDGPPVAGGGKPSDLTVVESNASITLDSVREAILPESWVAIVRPGKEHKLALTVRRAAAVDTVSRADYGVTARATQIRLGPANAKELDAPADLDVATDWTGWLQPEISAGTNETLTIRRLRKTVVYAQSERLELAEAPDNSAFARTRIELDGFYAGLEAGRWLIVEGERTDLVAGDATPPADDSKETTVESSGVRTAEIVQIADVVQRATHGPGDTLHTHLTLTPPLANWYKRDTVTIYGNVVAATHGETRREVLGSGDAGQPYQRFSLKQAPMTFVPAATPSGVASTLKVRVNDLEWHEVAALIDAKADDRVFVVQPPGDDGARIAFGDGHRGARLATGVENIKAQYRVGIGAAGNAPAGQVSQLMDRPLGAKEVRNPVPAGGGADPDTAAQARELAPLSVHALDRLVSAIDYQHFAQLFAGIAKATATEMWSGVHTKIVVAAAAAGGMPLGGTALHASLVSALRQFGDPSRAVDVVDVERHMLVIKAGIRLQPDYLFEAVQPQVESALFDAFGFDRRRLGDELHLSQVLAVMQRVRGVLSVDVDVFATISEADVVSEKAFDAKMASLKGAGLPPERLPLRPAAPANGRSTGPSVGWLVYLSPRVPRSVRLEEIA